MNLHKLMIFAVVLALVFIVFKVHKPVPIKEPFGTNTFLNTNSDIDSDTHLRVFTKPNYYGLGTWGRQYDSPIYYRDGSGSENGEIIDGNQSCCNYKRCCDTIQ